MRELRWRALGWETNIQGSLRAAGMGEGSPELVREEG